jgi:acyl carrier protein
MALDVNDVHEKTRQYIVSQLIRDARYNLKNDQSIMKGGLIDSFALAELSVFVEDTFGVYIPDSDLTVAQMDTLDQIVARIMRG